MAPRRSHWREFAFIGQEVVAAILPRLGISTTLDRWLQISSRLADSKRTRQRQNRSLS